MFGFSRGAFTAKFLARMVNTVGLLCKGNEEMVPFAYRLFQRYLAGNVQAFHGGKDHKGGRTSVRPEESAISNGPGGPADVPPSGSGVPEAPAAAAAATTNGTDPATPAVHPDDDEQPHHN